MLQKDQKNIILEKRQDKRYLVSGNIIVVFKHAEASYCPYIPYICLSNYMLKNFLGRISF
ncbi:MAG: hypothetical protein AMK74_03770 [Nitrospira bacterium SM23_35]|nr:MAG: hypothetical protein AMK74_03770 [Nitrospira bacterium SM23_35]